MSRPAVDPLFRSLAVTYGPRAIGLVLTGLLNDGAAGIADIARCGGLAVVQNPSDSEAASMPQGALDTGSIEYRAPIADMASLLASLVRREAPPSRPAPRDILLEVEIALGRQIDSTKLNGIAQPVALACPACGGTMSQMESWPPLRFRCQVGHAYTADALAKAKESAADEAMRVALRIVEERAILLEKMAADARRLGRNAAAPAYEERVWDYRAQAEILRRALLAAEPLAE